jgi:hypothetical protein
MQIPVSRSSVFRTNVGWYSFRSVVIGGILIVYSIQPGEEGKILGLELEVILKIIIIRAKINYI